ncbi:hypothetical protein Tco_1455333 [Tanacetum coccineum]
MCILYLSTGLETLFEITLSETEQLKIATKRIRIQTLNSQASGSGDGVEILSKVPNEQVHEKTSTNEGADEEEISDQLVRTPSDYQTTDESEKQKEDDGDKDGEEDKERDVMNVNLEGGDVDMTDADTTKDTEDAHVTLMAANPVVQH